MRPFSRSQGRPSTAAESVKVKPSPEKLIGLLSARNGSFSKQCPFLAAPVQNCAKASVEKAHQRPGGVNGAYTPRLLLFSDFKTDCPRQPTWESAAGPVIEIPERLSQSPAHRVAGPQGRANSSTRTAEAALHRFG